MSNAPKRKKLEKIVPELPVSTQKFYCCRCGTAYSRQKGYFPVSHSPMYRGSGYLPMCSDCVEKLYEHYRATLGSDKEAIRRICMKLDLYWSESIYTMVERTSGTNSRVRNYIGKTNIVRYIDKTFDDTIKEEETLASRSEETESSALSEATAKQNNEEAEATPPVDPSVIDFWGSGFTPDFYIELERRYQVWTKDLKSLDTNEQALYKQICILETTINRDAYLGKPIDRNISTLNTLLGSMNLKPAQRKDEDLDASINSTPFGVWIRRWENTKPIPEPDPELKDVDGIVRYISIWFFGHLCKMFGIKNSYCKLYEDEIAKMRIERPEYQDEDDESFFNDVFAEADNRDTGDA